MHAESSITIACPFCGQTFEMLIESALGPQELVSDCEVCCRPLRIMLSEDTAPRVEPA